jgi:hypothetical protein
VGDQNSAGHTERRPVAREGSTGRRLMADVGKSPVAPAPRRRATVSQSPAGQTLAEQAQKAREVPMVNEAAAWLRGIDPL